MSVQKVAALSRGSIRIVVHSSFGRLACCALLAGVLTAQTRLHLKTSPLRDSALSGPVAQRSGPARRIPSDSLHLLVQFEGQPDPQQLSELDQRGASFVQYVPDSGYLFSFPAGQNWGRTLLNVSRFEAQDKISPALGAPDAGQEAGGYLVAEFHPDVDPQEARDRMARAGFEILPSPDVLSNHLLIRGPLGRLEDLTRWDGVAYVFPASDELVAGVPVVACPGALTALGPVGQYVAAVGEGWDGPGLGSADLGYYFQRLMTKLPADQIRSEVLRAFTEWTRFAQVSFAPVSGPNFARTLNILFAPRSHGDAYPFDGPGRVLAHTFYPSPPNPETIAGDLHFDEDEEWVAGADLSIRSVDLYSVTLHELGHALGLAHSDVPGSVMYPYYRRASILTAEDINAIQTLYAAPSSTPGGGTPPGEPPPPAAPLVLTLGSPAVYPLTTTASSLTISGSVSGGSGDVRVSWTSDRGRTGVALGGRSWTVAVLLLAGSNSVTITAYDELGVTASRSIAVTYTSPGDTVAPSLKITSPAWTSVLTSLPTIRLAGTASDNVAVDHVTWSTSTGKSGTATGTVFWNVVVPLLIGNNTIVVRAYDAAGNSAWRSVSVTRR